MKNILSVCAFLLAFGALPLWGQSQDPLNEDQTTVRILEGDNSDPSIVRYGKSYYLVHSSFVYTPGLVVLLEISGLRTSYFITSVFISIFRL